MKQKISELIEMPQGVSCSFENNILTCSKDSVKLLRKINIPGVRIILGSDKISFQAAGNKKVYKTIKSYAAHIRNMFSGLNNKFSYKLEACNVHFPITLKLDGKYLVINNFLGEKVSRRAEIIPGVDVDIKGLKITLTSHDIEAAGQTAANIEKATRIRNRDRRIFQDGIFIVEKPGDKRYD